MDRIWQILEWTSSTGSPFTAQAVVMSLLLAFVLGQVLAWVYYFTHSGLSYSRSFVQSLILITVVVAMVMAVIGSSIITAVGLMGALAIIRFRNVIKDTRDVAFIFCCLVVGMAAGSQRYGVAIIGTIFLSMIVLYLHFASFGTREPHNGFLRFTLANPEVSASHVSDILESFCSSFNLISAQNTGIGGPEMEYAYQLFIRNTANSRQMLAELQNIDGIGNISLTMQERLLEI
jgi:uncharacterized membrane protein YhiD involved in acid resistance